MYRRMNSKQLEILIAEIAENKRKEALLKKQEQEEIYNASRIQLEGHGCV